MISATKNGHVAFTVGLIYLIKFQLLDKGGFERRNTNNTSTDNDSKSSFAFTLLENSVGDVPICKVKRYAMSSFVSM